MKHEQFPARVLEGSVRFTLFTFCVHSACRVIKVGVEFTGLLMSFLANFRVGKGGTCPDI